MVIGLLANANIAQSTVNNLYEADYDASMISLVSKDPKIVSQIGDTAGPVNGFTTQKLKDMLISHNLAVTDISFYMNELGKNKIFIALSGTVPDTTSIEMLKSASAESIKIVKTN